MWCNCCSIRYVYIVCMCLLCLGCSNFELKKSTRTPINKDKLVSFFLSGLSTSTSHACRINKSNKIVCWGYILDDSHYSVNPPPSNVQIPSYSFHPPTPLEDREFKAVSTGSNYTCAIDANNHAWCWGINDKGQLGIANTTNKPTPVMITGNNKFKQITTGNTHTCAIDTNNSAWCWGDNEYGQLGVGSTKNSLQPAMVSSTHKFQSIAAGHMHTCAIDMDNNAWCWGLNNEGQLATGDVTDELKPTMLPNTYKFKFISAGWSHTCGVDMENNAWCWGKNDEGQLGIGVKDRTFKYQPTKVHGTHKFEYVLTGRVHTCGIKPDATVFCWGYNNSGQLGNNKILKNIDTPTAISSSKKFKSISLHATQTCGVDTDDEVWCWGVNKHLKRSSAYVSVPPSKKSIGMPVKSLTMGNEHMCVLDQSNKAWCWGDCNESGRLGTGDTLPRTAPTLVSGDHEFIYLVSGGEHTCGLDTDNYAWCWGSNGENQLGNIDVNVPPVYGTNEHGQQYLIDGGSSYSSEPVAVSDGHQFQTLVLDNGSTCGIDFSNNIYCWGSTSSLKVNYGDSPVYLPTPTMILNPTDESLFVAIGSGSNDIMCRLDLDNKLLCWGYNGIGMLGTDMNLSNNFAPISSPIEVLHPLGTTYTWQSVIIGLEHACAIDSSNKAFCWGMNTYSQLGVGDDRKYSFLPVPVAGNHEFKSLHTDLGSKFTCAIDMNDKAWCWGAGYTGQLGEIVFENQSTPVAVAKDTRFKSIVIKDNTVYAIDMSSEIWHWGVTERARTAGYESSLPIHVKTN